MTTDALLPALLGFLMPVGLFVLAWGGMAPERARRGATVGVLALALGTLGYFSLGFAFHLGGAFVMVPMAGLESLDRIFAGQAGGQNWGLIGLSGFALGGDEATPQTLGLFLSYLPMVAMAVLLPALSLNFPRPVGDGRPRDEGRGRGWQQVVVGLLVAALLFPLAGAWTWGGGWLSRLGASLDLAHGFVDYGGSGVVFLLGGAVALGVLLGLGQRLPRREPGVPAPMPPAHFPLLANLGMLLLAVGWLGWTAAVPFHVAGAAVDWPTTAVSGVLAMGGAALVSWFYCWLVTGDSDPLMVARGTTAGLIAVSAAAPFLPPWAALVVGAAVGLLLPPLVYLVEQVLRLPDETAAVSMGWLGGMVGLLAVAFFAAGRWGQGWNGIGAAGTGAGQGVAGLWPAVDYAGDGGGQFLAQIAGILAIALLGLLPGWLVGALLSLPDRLRARAAATLESTAGEPLVIAAEAGTDVAAPEPRRRRQKRMQEPAEGPAEEQTHVEPASVTGSRSDGGQPAPRAEEPPVATEGEPVRRSSLWSRLRRPQPTGDGPHPHRDEEAEGTEAQPEPEPAAVEVPPLDSLPPAGDQLERAGGSRPRKRSDGF